MTIWHHIMTSWVRLRSAIILIAVGSAVGLAGGLLIGSRDRDPDGPADPMPVEGTAEPQTPSPAETQPAGPDLAAIADEYRLAARSVYFLYRKGYPVGKRVADYCENRLAEGLPIGTANRHISIIKPMIKWAAQLSAEARNEYARRCLELAVDVKAGREPSPRLTPNPIEPLALYAAAANITADAATCDRALRLFYTEAHRLQGLADAAKSEEERSADARARNSLLRQGYPVPYGQQLCNWWELAAGRSVSVPDPR